MVAPRTTVDHVDRPAGGDWLDVEWVVLPLAVLIDLCHRSRARHPLLRLSERCRGRPLRPRPGSAGENVRERCEAQGDEEEDRDHGRRGADRDERGLVGFPRDHAALRQLVVIVDCHVPALPGIGRSESPTSSVPTGSRLEVNGVQDSFRVECGLYGRTFGRRLPKEENRR